MIITGGGNRSHIALLVLFFFFFFVLLVFSLYHSRANRNDNDYYLMRYITIQDFKLCQIQPVMMQLLN